MAIELKNFLGEGPQTPLHKNIPSTLPLTIRMHCPPSLALRAFQTFLPKPILTPVYVIWCDGRIVIILFQCKQMIFRKSGFITGQNVPQDSKSQVAKHFCFKMSCFWLWVLVWDRLLGSFDSGSSCVMMKVNENWTLYCYFSISTCET